MQETKENKTEKGLPVLDVQHLKKYFPIQTNLFGKVKVNLKAVEDITFQLQAGKTIGVVGESGCGKTTLGRTILRLYDITGGKVIYYGRSIDEFLPAYYLNTIRLLPLYKSRFLNLKKSIIAQYELIKTTKENSNFDYEVLKNLENLQTFPKIDELQEICNTLEKMSEPEDSRAKSIAKQIEKLIKLLTKVSSTTGGLILSDNVNSIRTELLTKLKLEKKLMKLTLQKRELDSRLEVCEDSEKKATLTAKLQELIDAINLNKTNTTIASQSLGLLKNEIENTNLYLDLENRREKGLDLNRLKTKEMRLLRTEIQLIFQDPYSSLPPRMTVGAIITEAVKVHHIVPKNQIKEHVRTIMKKCGLQPQYYDRYPHEFSGGQRQRICIARALAVNPKLVICDEPVSALDVSIQAQIINLLKELQKDLGLTYVFISHDLSVVKYITDTIMVMYLGNMMEIGDTKDIFKNPLHPYTQALFSAVPVPNPDAKMNRIILKGDIPSPANPPEGCKFHTRCEKCMEVCKHIAPKFIQRDDSHYVACHLYDEEIMSHLEEYNKESE